LALISKLKKKSSMFIDECFIISEQASPTLIMKMEIRYQEVQ